jgi:hypothetical protein
MNKDKEASIREYKPEAMRKTHFAMIHSVVLSINSDFFHLRVPTGT